MFPRAPRHHQATAHPRSRLFNGPSAFSALERRIGQLPIEKERGDACEVFVQGHPNTDETAQADEICVTANLPPQIRHALNLPGSDDGDDGVFGSGFANQLPGLLFKSVAKSGFVNYVWSYRKNNSNKCEKGMKPARTHAFQKPKAE